MRLYTGCVEMRMLRKESLRVILLDGRYQLIRVEQVSLGTINESIAHPRDILRPAMIHLAHAIVVAHNHPSGDVSPSQTDHSLTRRLAEAAANQQQSHLDYLEALLSAEMEERERNTVERRLRDAHLPKVKALDEFNFSSAPHISASKLKELAAGDYIERAEPVLFIGDSGTGKTHLLTALSRPMLALSSEEGVTT